MSDLLNTLKNVFGYGEFRPLQREIIQANLDGRDVFALLPTGGGKSLCFQLPALIRDGVTVVVSPLIALMKDQVDQLQETGIAATSVASTMANFACSTPRPNGSCWKTGRAIFVRGMSRRWRLTKRTAFPNGDMIFDPSIANSRTFGNSFPECR